MVLGVLAAVAKRRLDVALESSGVHRVDHSFRIVNVHALHIALMGQCVLHDARRRRASMDRQRVEEFRRSYGAASLKGDPIAVADHYGFPFTAFTLGDVSTFADRDEANQRVTWQLDKFASAGIGTARLDGCEIVPVSDHLALCHLTWSSQPDNGIEPWSWTNVYALRQAGDGTLYFEAAFADNEIAELLARCPDVFTAPEQSGDA